ncbi:MAG: helix-turn-helix transcriptional regulator, partial [Clostridia bacterium]|nr:helix-turn-helix transcriptional regulator [Clostridia bacterium]
NLCPGDMAIWAPDVNRFKKVISDKETEFTVIHFTIENGGFDEDFFGRYRLSHNSGLLSKVLHDEIKEQNGAVTDVATCVFTALLSRCIREASNSTATAKNTSFTIYRDAISYMNDKINVMLSVPEIAHNCGICETTLKNAFRHHTGISVKKYYSNVKIEKAVELLKKGTNAKEVAAMLGFSTLSYFSQFFKRETGCSIRDYLSDNNIG